MKHFVSKPKVTHNIQTQIENNNQND